MIKNGKKLEQVEPLLVEWLKDFDKDYNYEFSTKGINIVVTEGLRDIETQKKYFETGKSQTLKSKHLKNKNGKSQAIDIAFEINGKINWNDLTYWKLAGKHFKEYFGKLGIKVQHGGDWVSFKDFPHYQLDNTPEYQFTKTIKLGDKNEDVEALQSKLISKGYKLIADGDFGNKTLEAVKDFQNKNGMVGDGIVGRMTWSKL